MKLDIKVKIQCIIFFQAIAGLLWDEGCIIPLKIMLLNFKPCQTRFKVENSVIFISTRILYTQIKGDLSRPRDEVN